MSGAGAGRRVLARHRVRDSRLSAERWRQAPPRLRALLASGSDAEASPQRQSQLASNSHDVERRLAEQERRIAKLEALVAVQARQIAKLEAREGGMSDSLRRQTDLYEKKLRESDDGSGDLALATSEARLRAALAQGGAPVDASTNTVQRPRSKSRSAGRRRRRWRRRRRRAPTSGRRGRRRRRGASRRIPRPGGSRRRGAPPRAAATGGGGSGPTPPPPRVRS